MLLQKNKKEYKIRINICVLIGRIVTDNDDDMNAVISNLTKATQTWGNLHRIISQDKQKNIKTSTSIYRTIVLSRLLYGSETWILTPRLMQLLEVFHRRCMRLYSSII